MDNSVNIKVADLIGSPLCISSEDGNKVYDQISALIKDGRDIVLSFERVKLLISLFLNAAIGRLYGSFNEDEIRAHLRVEGLTPEDMEILKKVVANAKKYYANPRQYDEAWKNTEGEDEE